jgi:expansin (peptidoglycan-binding protein)
MPALAGGVISTLVDATGTPVFVIYEWFVPLDQPNGGTLRDVATTTSRGTRTGALVVDNMTGRSQRVVVTNPETGNVRNFNIGTTGAVLTAAQLAALAPPDGPITTIQDLAGISPSIT